ncbi:MAG: STAS domain-containing protein [Coriobacteriia bacterium]|nr:STAS domain-containing protein [Coriobacteriia bacterium]
MALTINQEQGSAFWLLELLGDLDYAQCSSLREVTDGILENESPAMIIDLSGLEYLDSSGLGLLLSLSKELQTSSGKLVLITNETVDNILSLTRLNGVFSIAENLLEARQLITGESQL